MSCLTHAIKSLISNKVELVVIRDPQKPVETMEVYKGDFLEDLLKSAFKSGLNDSIRFYDGSITKEREIFKLDERTDKSVIDKFANAQGRIYAQVVPMGLAASALWAIAGSVAVSFAATYLLAPKQPNMPSITPQSPNNSLTQRTNQARPGGRVADIFGEVWSFPDLIANTYTVYINGKEVEYSYFCIGRGKYDVKQALDDTTPIQYVNGSSVLVFDPDTGLNDEPAFVFGDQFNPDEAEFAALTSKRYTSVNGQDLPYPDSYSTLPITFKAPNIIETSDEFNFALRYQAGGTITIEGADNLASANNVMLTDADGNEYPAVYALSSQYEIESVTAKQIVLKDPSNKRADWQMLADNADHTVERDITLSQEASTLWQGYHYTEEKDHDGAYINFVALNGLYATSKSGNIYGRRIDGVIESEIVDSNGNPIDGTLHRQEFFIQSPAMYEGAVSNDDTRRSTAASTVKIENPNFTKGKRLRWRAARTTPKLYKDEGSVVQDVKIKDFYSYRKITNADMPKGVTTAYSKTLGTEGALAIKERKLRMHVVRYVIDYDTKELKLSKRVDDIMYHAAIDPLIGNLTDAQVDFEQIKQEIDILVEYFGSEKFAEFCHTFDDTNTSSEETLQIMANAAFSIAKRDGMKLMIDFERQAPASLAIFNSHNILPGTFKTTETYGVINNHDGARVKYRSATDDEEVTKEYPNENLVNAHEETLIGVRNELQATAHLMRIYNKDLFANKTCEFTAGDESNSVVRSNRITAPDQFKPELQEGVVTKIEERNGKFILRTSNPVSIDDKPHNIFIQTVNNGVESISIAKNDDYSVQLARMPTGVVSTERGNAVHAIYQIVKYKDIKEDNYIVTQKDPGDGLTNKLTCSNYDDRYYQNDHDYIKSVA